MKQRIIIREGDRDIKTIIPPDFGEVTLVAHEGHITYADTRERVKIERQPEKPRRLEGRRTIEGIMAERSAVEGVDVKGR